MKKCYICLIFLCFTFTVIAQSGIATYKKEWTSFGSEEGMKELKKTNSQRYREYSKMKLARDRLAKRLKYELKFDKNEAEFKLPELMSVDDDPYMALATGPSDGIYYSNLKTGNTFFFTDSFNNSTYLIEYPPYKWEITNEQRMINGFSCFKAKGTLKTWDGSLEVWFAPQLNIPLGPRGVTGLPGLVVQVEYGAELFTLIDIDLEEKPAEIKKPEAAHEVTLAEWKEIQAKANNKIKSLIKGDKE